MAVEIWGKWIRITVGTAVVLLGVAAAVLVLAAGCDEGEAETGTERGFAADILVDEIEINKDEIMLRELTPEEERVMVHKGTEAPFSGQYCEHKGEGVYTCKRCGARLFESKTKFESGTGWPSFDEAKPGAVRRERDTDGMRTEILCGRCGGHLGHIFEGESFTPKNARSCVNSLALDFTPAEKKTGRAIFASGCFWGTEHYLRRVPGVIKTTVGYTGGPVENPTYKQVCTGTTGHAEAVEVVFDPQQVDYETLARLFFETHDFTQLNRQGPDVGEQYRSVIFYADEDQKAVATKLIAALREKGHDVKTAVAPTGRFWPAEDYHQDYYEKTGGTPYCHVYRKVF